MTPLSCCRVWLYLMLTCHVIVADYWSIWTEWSECSRTCDSGAAYQLRRCLRSRRFARSCDGDDIRYSTCNTKDCPSRSADFRLLQCAAHNDEHRLVTKVKWVPYHDSTSPCSLYCQAQGTSTIRRFSPKVLDGTRCRSDSQDICINGKCWPVGCDKILGSHKYVDSCGICGGNNTCHPDIDTMWYRWINTGYGPCSATCGVGYQQRRVACQNSRTRRLVNDDNCQGRDVIERVRRKCTSVKCPPSWRVGPWYDCTQTCGGGFAWRTVICVDTFLDGTQRVPEDTQCPLPKPSTRKSCGNLLCPKWYAGEWTPCSVSCGPGHQQRDVVCRHIGIQFCTANRKPVTVKNCTTTIPCSAQPYDIQEVYDGEQRDSFYPDDVIYDDSIDIDQMGYPRFVVSRWGPCSTSCGKGIRYRFVRCKVYLSFLESLTDLPESDCQDIKPSESEECIGDPCLAHFEYRISGETPCSRSCLGGVKESILKCVNKFTDEFAPETMCAEAERIPIERNVCNDVPCPQRWEVEHFGRCSATCGGGFKLRNVTCVQEFASGRNNLLHLPDFMCNQPTPPRKQHCNRVDCPPMWVVGNWSQCSTSCGVGISSRDVFCVRELSSGQTVNVTYAECWNILQPDRFYECNETKCPTPKIKTVAVVFFQLNKIKKVRLSVGMKASVLPGTTVIIKCTSKGVNKKHIQWYKDGSRIYMTSRVKLTQRYALKIKKSRPEVDAGIYTCKFGHVKANMTLLFSTVYDLFHETVVRESCLSQMLAETSIGNMTTFQKDPLDRTIRPLYLVEVPWSPCSATCSGGLQKRNVTCEIITNDYYEVFPMRTCIKAGYSKPEVIRSCNIMPCTYWKVGEWSECLPTKCTRHMFSVLERSVVCISEEDENMRVNTSLCEGLMSGPHPIMECINVNCTARWNTSSWSNCMGACDEQGFKARMLSCTWAGTGLPANRHCEGQRKPRVRKRCFKKCPRECIDESGYCSIVKLMNLCTNFSFRKRCCLTCS